MLFSLTSAALACGGMFCTAPTLPVDQAGERIVFALDSAAGRVEMHTQIAYEGPAEQFSWLVPVPAQPELFLSTDELFTFLDRNTAPIFQLQSICECCDDMLPTDRNDTDASEDLGGDGVTVVERKQVGPYDTVTLQATTAEVLVDWLRANQYLVPEDVEKFLEPYVAAGSYVVALRLQKDRDAGDLEPIGLSWPGDTPMIPLTMTAVAATDDMPMIPWVFADSRAVPENYLHVVLNDLAIDWFSSGSNYSSVVSRAADEAGGQAFATDFAGPTRPMIDQLAGPRRFNLFSLRDTHTTRDLLIAVASQGFVIDNRLIDLIEAHLPGAAAVAADVYAGSFDTGGMGPLQPCSEDATLAGCDPVDTTAAVDALDTEIIQPLLRANALFERFSYVTRLTSSASPAEMTVDPRFVLNAELPEVSQTRTATLTFNDCEGGDDVLTLPDGTSIALPRGERPDLASAFSDIPTRRIEATGRSGAPTVMRDNTEAITSRLAQLGFYDGGPASASASACGCDNSASPTGALLLVAVLGRRRRAV